MATSVTYAGHTITLDDLLNARTAIEEMTRMHKGSIFDTNIHVGGTTTTVAAIQDVCTLASAMWYKLSTEQND